MLIKPLLRHLENFLLPEYCVACAQVGSTFCPACRVHIPILPARCPLCGRSSRLGFICPTCQQKNLDLAFDALYAYGDYQRSELNLAIQALKYRGARPLGKILGKMLGRQILRQLEIGDESPLLQEPLVIPLPLHARRERERGYNQAALIAAGVASAGNWPLDYQLKRLSYQRPSAKSTYAKRQGQKKLFYYPHNLQQRAIILVDDVVTTGATLQAAARALKQAGAGLILAAVIAQSR